MTCPTCGAPLPTPNGVIPDHDAPLCAMSGLTPAASEDRVLYAGFLLAIWRFAWCHRIATGTWPAFVRAHPAIPACLLRLERSHPRGEYRAGVARAWNIPVYPDADLPRGWWVAVDESGAVIGDSSTEGVAS